MYGRCGQLLPYSVIGNSTVNNPNIVSLKVDDSVNFECYTAIASTDTMTVVVIQEAKGSSGNVQSTS